MSWFVDKLRSFATQRSPLWIHCLLLVLLCGFQTTRLESRIDSLSRDKVRLIVSNDSGHYLKIAKRFYEDGPSLDYEKKFAHRQPMYPFMLFLGMKLGLESPRDLLRVNVGILLAGTLCVYLYGLWAYPGGGIALLSALMWIFAPVVSGSASTRLLTEPLFAVLLMISGFAMLEVLRHLSRGSSKYAVFLFTFSAFASLAYQTRPNGLFVYASGLGVFVVVALLSSVALRKSLGLNLVLSGLIFVSLSSPSLIAKSLYRASPIDHGYLSNYLWAESYEEGHDSNRKVTFRDFAERNTVGSALERLLSGYVRALTALTDLTDRSKDWRGIGILLGMALLLFFGARPERLYLLWIFASLFLIAWSFKANPVARIPQTQIFPLAIALIGPLCSLLMNRVRRVPGSIRSSWG